jgi:LEA14-like dessication related protein
MSDSQASGADGGGATGGGDSSANGDEGGGGRSVGRIVKLLALGISGLVLLVVVLFVLGVLGLPETQLEDNRWGEVEGQDVEVITEVGLDNPNPFGFGGEADVEYGVDLEGVRLAEGVGSGLEVSSGYNTLNFTTTLFSENLSPWWSSHLNNGEVSSLEADATADVRLGPLSGSHDTTIEDEIETDIEGALDESSSEFEGEYSLADTGLSLEPSVNITDATTEWGEVTNETTEIVTTLTIHNPNAYPIPTPAFAGGIEMNGESIVDWQAGDVRILDAEGNRVVGEEAVIPGETTEERTFIAEMDNQNVSVWFPTHVDSEQPVGNPGVEFTQMVVTSQLAFELNGERFTIPPGGQAIACEFDLTTSIFVDQDGGMAPQGCGLTAFEQPREQLEAVGAVLDEDDLGLGDDDDGPLP